MLKSTFVITVTSLVNFYSTWYIIPNLRNNKNKILFYAYLNHRGENTNEFTEISNSCTLTVLLYVTILNSLTFAEMH